MRETARDKAARILTEGRLTVDLVTTEEIRAVCLGDDGLYRLGYDPARRWWCDCPAFGLCSHLYALQRIALTPSPRRWQEAWNGADPTGRA